MQQIPILKLTRIAAAAVLPQRFVGFDNTNIGVAGAKPMGVADYGAGVGEAFAVNTLGTAKIEAGAAFNDGDPVKSDATGKAIGQAGVGEIAGYALQDAVAGQIAEILLTP